MKKIVLLFGSLLILAGGFGQCPVWNIHGASQTDLPTVTTQNHNSTGWHPDFNFTDEFDGTTLNTFMWNTLPQGQCHGMSPEAYFKPSNAWVTNGKLILHSQLESLSVCGRQYSSGWIGSNERIRYGFIEVQFNMPSHYSQQPCFWLFGQESSPFKYDEIDVGEYSVDASFPNYQMLNNTYRIRPSSISGVNELSVDVSYSYFNQPFTVDVITFGVEWFPQEIIFYVNGEVVRVRKFTTNMSQVSLGDHPIPSDFTCTDFTQSIPQWLQLSFSLRDPIPSTLENLEVEYLRSYKLRRGIMGTYWPTYINLSDPLLSLVHTDIHIGGDPNHMGWFPWYSRINLWAENSITLDKGFEVDPHTDFTARVVSTSPECFLPNTPDNNQQNTNK